MKRSAIICIAIAGITGICRGIFLPDGSLSLADLFLKLGGLVPSTSFADIFDYLLSQLPWLAIDALLCIGLYRCFCVASVYYFSRCAKRNRWYLRETGKTALLLVAAVITEGFACVTACCMAGHPVEGIGGAAPALLAAASVTRLLYHCSLVLVMFTASLLFTSGIGFFFGYAANAAMLLTLTALHLPEPLGTVGPGKRLMLALSPPAHTIASWHTPPDPVPGMDLLGLGQGYSFSASLVILFALTILLWSAGWLAVSKHEFLAENPETEVI